MRLEKIVLNGFKSFADKTEFTFNSPITAIVGPNGCGKSNVVDAVKWVLGEQSVKSLRSGHMADVIFSGSSSRKAIGTAEVSLHFSNTTGKLPIETDEVQISRRIYKSGECEYRINNNICRLKDIREMFMDTGVGTKAYSIIEQGQIEQLLSASKSERRVIFEEAAGISKYKAHKNEALRKLDRTEQNLLRLADILAEVQKQLRSVKYQAGKARNYLKYTQRLKELQVNYSLAEFDKITTKTAEKNTILAEIEQQFAVIAAEVSKNEASMSRLGNEIIETENQINHADNSLVSVQSKIEQHLQKIEFLRARVTELQQRKETAVQQIGKHLENRKLFETDLGRYKVEMAGCERTLEEKQQKLEQLGETIQQINKECGSLERNLEDEKSGIIDIVRRTAQLHNEIQSISVYRDNLSNQKSRLAGRANTAKEELEKLLTEKAQYNARLNDIETILKELNENLVSKRKESQELDGTLTSENKRLSQSKEALSALSSELSVLTDMESRREGLNNAVKSILSQKDQFDYVQGILADIIVADAEYADSIEAVLEGKTDALIIRDTARLLSDTEKINKLDGRVNFISMDKIEPFVDKVDLSQNPHIKGRAVEFVNYKSKDAQLVWKLLGKTLIVDSIEAAIELADSLGKNYKFVTVKGEFVGSDGTIKLGPLGKSTGLISRKSRVRQLQVTINNLSAGIEETEEQIEKNRQKNEHLTNLCKDLRTAVYEASTEKTQISSQMSVYDQNIKKLSEEQPLLAGEIDLLKEQIDQSVKKEYESKQQLEELEEVNSQRTARIEELEAKFSERKSLQQSQTAELTELKVSVGQITEQSKAIKQTIATLQSQLHENRSSAETAETEIENCDQQSSSAQREILGCEAAVTELFVDKDKSQENSHHLHEKVESLLEEQKQTEQLVRQKRSEQSEVDQKINELKIELSQFEVREQDLIERIQDQLQINLRDAYENYTDTQVDWEKVTEEIGDLREKIERLGNVNVDAIEEQEELENRNEFLSEQVQDLNNSKGQLQQLINRLNKKSRERFRETFEEIRGHFQQIFRKLFGGGKADIVLEEAEDILDAGIEIIARPPGKETRSISLLSGGEKSMTALALLFSVFKAKPSPFCLLDEVDAALDEANNERFNLLIREFQKDTQFIIITHAKRTMSIADILYGITMQTRGVSKKISVRFDQFGEVEDQDVESVAVA